MNTSNAAHTALLTTVLGTLLFAAAAVPCAATVKTAAYNGKSYDISLKYDDECYPGDAVFIRMKLTSSQGYKKTKTSASVELKDTKKKRIDSTDFFALKNGINGVELLAGIPLSSFIAPDTYTLTITYSFSGMDPMEFSLPLTVLKKEFTEETIPLDGKNTAIKKDDSKERYQQIQKLNAILETSNPASVYQLSAFSLPVQSPRRTSFFADRRIYTYQGGGQTTGLHYGIDFGVPEGTIVSACAAGKVVMAEMRNSTGYSVVIEHLPGLYSLYYHLSSMNVKAGQMVKQHDKIGLSGQTGLATGPHLHWEIRLNTAAVSPDFFTGNFAYEPVK